MLASRTKAGGLLGNSPGGKEHEPTVTELIRFSPPCSLFYLTPFLLPSDTWCPPSPHLPPSPCLSPSRRNQVEQQRSILTCLWSLTLIQNGGSGAQDLRMSWRADKSITPLKDEGSNLYLSHRRHRMSPTLASLTCAVHAPLIDAQTPSWMTQ